MKQLRYPKERLEDESDYLKMSIAEYVAPLEGVDKPFSGNDISIPTGSSKNAQGLKNPLTQIILPIPRNIQDTLPVDWTDGSLNPLDAFLLKTGTTVIEAGRKGAGGVAGAVETALGGASNALNTLSKDPNQQNSLIAGLVAKAIGGNVGVNQIISRATGQVLNPNLELLFNGVNLRQFDFNFEFFPRNLKEAEEVKQIIRCLKYAMVPKRGDNKLFIKAPYVFQLQYMKGNSPHPFLNKFLPMAMTNISVNYTASNRYSTFHDGTPTHMNMRLEFKELNPIYKEDYNNTQGQGGVGY